MSFIGIIANKKYFENIKKKILEEIKNEAINFVQINIRSIENIKNIKFDILIIEDNIEKFKDNKKILEKICYNTNYLMINTDKNIEYEKTIKAKQIITYGLNQKATITVSSISDTDILIYLQKSIYNKENNKIEIEERRINREENSIYKTYEILVIYTILKIYNANLIEII